MHNGREQCNISVANVPGNSTAVQPLDAKLAVNIQHDETFFLTILQLLVNSPTLQLFVSHILNDGKRAHRERIE